MSTLEREAKDNVYAVLDPHIQYEITINKDGEPPTYLSLSKPLTHQRTHAFDPQKIICNDVNNNKEKNFTTFKSQLSNSRRSYNNKDRHHNSYKKNYVCKANADIEYSKDPNFGTIRENVTKDIIDMHAQNNRNNENRNSKKYSQIHYQNSSRRRKNYFTEKTTSFDKDLKRTSERGKDIDQSESNKTEKERSFEECEEIQYNMENKEENQKDYEPRPGKVKEIASIFNRNSMLNLQPNYLKKERPKPLQSYGYQAYLDHVFPDAVEI